jgi:hypothetical protein
MASDTSSFARALAGGRGALNAGIEPPGQLPVDPASLSFWAMIDLPYGRDIRDVDTTAAAMGYNLRTGLDDRGLTYLRFGPPRKRTIGSTNAVDAFCQLPDLERWQYDDIGTVRFFRPEAVSVGAIAFSGTTGEQVFRPMNEPEFQAMEQAMTHNATSVSAPLSFGVWTAQFAGTASARTDIVVVTTRGAAAAQLVGPVGEMAPPGEDSGGIVILRARPGWYVLMANAKVGDTLGRQGLHFLVHTLGGERGVSDLLLSPTWGDTTTTRDAMLGRLQRDLTFSAGTTLRAYAELYGLRPGADGYARYRASYQIYRTGDLARDARRDSLAGGVRLTFERLRAPTGDRIVEWLDITPGEIPAGRYLLRLEVLTPDGEQRVGRAQMGFEVKEPE